MTDNSVLLRLAAYRLDNDLTFESLATQMAEAGFPVRARSLHLVLTNRLETGPRETTLHKITEFMRGIEAPRTRSRARKSAARKPRRRLGGMTGASR